VRCIKKSKGGPAVCPNFLVNDPAFLVIPLAFVVRLLRPLVERVGDAFVENLFGILWP